MKAIINRIIDIKLSSNYQFILGENLLEQLYDHIGARYDKKILLLSDERVWELYGKKINNSFSSHKGQVERLIIKPGEDQKNFSNLQLILEKLSEGEFKKYDLLVAIGGGVIGDIGGLAAGLYMRGIDHVIVPTTTLSAVDSSVGGKTAINMPEGKNLVGMFKQPSRVICDISSFESLDDENFYQGIVEALKMAFIYDIGMLKLFSKDLRTNKQALYELISQSIKGKYSKVKGDEFDEGKRLTLNFGHTLGHAIEKYTDYGYSHGQAVALGMVYMTKLSEALGFLPTEITNKEIILQYGQISPSQLLIEILKRYQLPYEFNFSLDELEDLMLIDKKNRGDMIKLVLLEDIGKAFVKPVEANKLKEFLEYE